MSASLVGSEMCIRDSGKSLRTLVQFHARRPEYAASTVPHGFPRARTPPARWRVGRLLPPASPSGLRPLLAQGVGSTAL
eukprot:9559076-Alexandrium_andersonii.AAC.1